MNFINKGDKHIFSDFPDDYPEHEETSKERYIPSYYNAVMKNLHSKTRSRRKGIEQQ